MFDILQSDQRVSYSLRQALQAPRLPSMVLHLILLSACMHGTIGGATKNVELPPEASFTEIHFVAWQHRLLKIIF
jgi:hypothetical protein